MAKKKLYNNGETSNQNAPTKISGVLCSGESFARSPEGEAPFSFQTYEYFYFAIAKNPTNKKYRQRPRGGPGDEGFNRTQWLEKARVFGDFIETLWKNIKTSEAWAWNWNLFCCSHFGTFTRQQMRRQQQRRRFKMSEEKTTTKKKQCFCPLVLAHEGNKNSADIIYQRKQQRLSIKVNIYVMCELNGGLDMYTYMLILYCIVSMFACMPWAGICDEHIRRIRCTR